MQNEQDNTILDGLKLANFNIEEHKSDLIAEEHKEESKAEPIDLA